MAEMTSAAIGEPQGASGDPSLAGQRNLLAACLDEAERIPGINTGACATLREKLAQNAFNLVVAGEFKRGKSSVINALLGADILPTAVVPLTSVITVIHYGEKPGATVVFNRGDSREIPLDMLSEYVTERGNPNNVKDVREVSVTYPAEWLQGGIHLVDTPGIGSIHQHNTDVTYQYLPNADAVIFVASVDQPVSQSETRFLADIRHHADKLFCLLNKADYLDEREQAEAVAFAKTALADTLGAPVPVFLVSAKLAMQGRLENDGELLAQSRLPEFDQALRRFLLDDKAQVWFSAVRRHLLRLLDEARLSIELERRALQLPLAELDAHLRAFEAKKRETLQEKSDCEALLEAEGRKLVTGRVETDLETLKRQLLPRLHAALDQWYQEWRHSGSVKLQAGLERNLVNDVRAAFEAWRIREDADIGEAFEGLCQRFWYRIQNTVDELLRYSAELFAIPFDRIGAESLWRQRSGFYYKFWQEPPNLTILAGSIVRLLPGFIAHPWILRQARLRAADLVDMQAGRLRYDFDERIKRSIGDFRREMMGRMEATIGGIEQAIEKGKSLKMKGSQEMAAREQELAATMIQIEKLLSRLAEQNAKELPKH